MPDCNSLRRQVMAFLAWLSLATAPGAAQAIINEVLADNRRAVAQAGSYPDLVELHNPSASQADLSGLGLTDDSSQPRKFRFPSGTRLEAGGYMLVWCGGDPAGSGWRAAFGLSDRGERLWLFAADGLTVLDQVEFGVQAADYSIGRVVGEADRWEVCVPTPGGPNLPGALGPASGLRLNEWMARPDTGDDWLELYNPASSPVALAGLVLTDKSGGVPDNAPLPPLSFIGPRGFVQLWASGEPEPRSGHLDFRLGASGETLTLLAADRTSVIDQVTYGAQTTDVSQGRAPDGGDTLRFFAGNATTPGARNLAPLDEIVISEVLSHTDPPFEDAIELHNPGAGAIDISHWWLSDAASTPKKFRIPAGTVVAPGRHVVFYEFQFGAGSMGFGLSSATGDEVHLSEGDVGGNLTGRQTSVAFGALRNGVSVGRVATSTGFDFVPLVSPTFGVDRPTSLAAFRKGQGASNALPRVGPVAITELHYQPAKAAAAGANHEFVELHNPTPELVRLYDPAYPTNCWRLGSAVSYDLPPGLALPSGGYLLVVDFDPHDDPASAAEFRAAHQLAADVPLVGPFSGSLSDSGEIVELLRPDEPEGWDSPEPGLVPYELVEQLAYLPQGHWPPGAAGTGGSLQRSVAAAYGNEPANWFVAPPTPGRAGVPDRDQDGVPDWWELQHGFEPANPGDAGTDTDADGASNRDEFLAGTGPRDPASVLQVRVARITSGGIWIGFPAVAGRTYGLEQSSLPGGRVWQRVATTPPVVSDGFAELQGPPPTREEAWFRVVILPE